MTPLLGLLIAPGLAHPVGERAATQTLSLKVLRERVEVDYWVDVPNAFLPTPEARAAMLTELASGLLLVADGRVLSLRLRAPSPEPSPSSEHTHGFSFHLEAPLPAPPPERLELSTANLQEASNFFAHDVQVDPAWKVGAASVLALRPDGEIARDDTLRWRRGEDARTAWVELAGRWPSGWLWLTGEGTEPLRARKALAPSPRDRLRPAVLVPSTWLLGLASAGLLGATGGRVRPGWALAVAALGLLLALLPGRDAGWVELGTALAALAWLGALQMPASRWLSAALAAAGLAATCHRLGPALGVLIAFGLGALLSSRAGAGLPSWAAAASVLGATSWLLVRAFSG